MIGAVILAAGGSSRMGRAKQLLRVGGTSLLHRTVGAALEAGCRPVIVVLGAEADRARDEVRDLPALVTVNEQWREGMAGSIRRGVKTLLAAEPAADGVLLVVCDQPLLSAEPLRGLCDAFDGREGRRVACAYAGTVGVPALFQRSLFDRLTCLEGDQGAKSLLLDAGDDLLTVPWPEGATEIDRPEDYEAFREDCGDS